MRKLALILFCLSTLTACASSGPVERRTELSMAELARALGCSSDEVPFCTDANCELRDYRCEDKSRVLESIFPATSN